MGRKWNRGKPYPVTRKAVKHYRKTWNIPKSMHKTQKRLGKVANKAYKIHKKKR